MRETYKTQVTLLLDVLTEISKEESFALHGGTAINLFFLDMPRLSVDIDLTFIPFSDDRSQDLDKIKLSLEAIKNRLLIRYPNIRFEDEKRTQEELKLICIRDGANVKVEVNQINRGLIAEPCHKLLCSRAEEEFDRFCEVKTVSVGQLWGGKIIAALDRQHPRDIFDVKNLLQTIGFTEEVKHGFLFFLMCGKRPIDEVLNPNFIDQSVVFKSQFSGMTDNVFTYTIFEEIRKELVKIVHRALTQHDKDLLLSFVQGSPRWTTFDYSDFPAIKWKLLNIRKLKESNFLKFSESVRKLEKLLETLR
ncbi:MAG TPA: nucleotidyl transferase AbiEii/AbiGii toxin family protein [Salinivirgaceae bacterium]|nr:nucleotidyl transferase AbiEii/AbiGii toxin family protein [Salinivirgaceae bacterium]HQA76488.1 nucleotidyl transferase AbiEii/AbiGii toxin family protein [Salinivirgaceae bacterium]